MDRKTFLMIPLAVLLLVGCTGQEGGFPEVEGWSREGEVQLWNAENLWEYINGAAELFLDYEVKTCHVADLTADDVTVTVEIYDMGTPLNAFGIFELESSGRGEEFPGAVEALVSPPWQALLTKGTNYIKVNTFTGELTEASGRSLLERIAEALPGQAGYPSAFDLLPRSGRVEGSEGYQAQGFLGLSDLKQCLHADYTGADETTWQGFVVHDTPVTATIWTDLAETWESMEHRGTTVLMKQIPYRGLVGVVQTDHGIMGVSGAEDRAQLIRRIDDFAF